MTDMITRIELEDAVRNQEKVWRRVEEVAIAIADIDRIDLPVQKGRRWTLGYMSIRLDEPRPGMEHLRWSSVTATLQCEWEDRPHTLIFGDPDDDEDSGFDEGYHRGEVLTRQVCFPYEYLLHDGWVEEAKARSREAFKRYARLQLNQLEEALDRNSAERKRLASSRTS
jgi:hypothetical protein